MNKKDEELARFRLKLEKRWGNDHDSSYAYIDTVTGESVGLTPFMMDEWVRALVSCNVLMGCSSLSRFYAV
jgi:hypothetical protein